MNYTVLDTIVLTHDLPEHGLKRGDLSAIVEIYGEDEPEVEFVTAFGQTSALITVSIADIRLART